MAGSVNKKKNALNRTANAKEVVCSKLVFALMVRNNFEITLADLVPAITGGSSIVGKFCSAF